MIPLCNNFSQALNFNLIYHMHYFLILLCYEIISDLQTVEFLLSVSIGRGSKLVSIRNCTTELDSRCLETNVHVDTRERCMQQCTRTDYIFTRTEQIDSQSKHPTVCIHESGKLRTKKSRRIYLYFRFSCVPYS